MSSADLRHLGQPDRDALEAAGARRLEQRVAEGRPAGADAHRQRQALHEALRVVLRLAPTARRRRAVRQVLAPPLRQQRGLAEAGRRLHEDHRVVAQLRLVGLQPRPRDLVARHARRRDLQQQVGDSAAGGQDRGGDCQAEPSCRLKVRCTGTRLPGPPLGPRLTPRLHAIDDQRDRRGVTQALRHPLPPLARGARADKDPTLGIPPTEADPSPRSVRAGANMYRHLLVPVDDTDLSIETIGQAVEFARKLGARITFFHAQPDHAGRSSARRKSPGSRAGRLRLRVRRAWA